eukprot:NODE_28_length_3230_cov_63.298743_g16_i0.p2 GENE.NODE_28_length_3230_cov_63.298743_g16_i0~~NODE_28_length_3230_cov_63.298743_g16_i0.p2  ORF type:complete len:308 (+),score=42.53 NODE_28_length_3230_cov_63.298743_g16_i0:2293-3216(+)
MLQKWGFPSYPLRNQKMKSKTILKTLLIFTLLIATCFTDDMWEKGQQIENDSWEDAIKYYMKISEDHSEKPLIAAKAYDKVAHCYTKMGQKLMAADCYVYAAELIEGQPDSKRQQQEWMAYAALNYEDSRKWELAAECYIKASELTANKVFANKYRISAGRAFDEIANYPEAIAICSLALENANNNIERSKIVKNLWNYKLKQAQVDAQDGAHKAAGSTYREYADYLLKSKKEKRSKQYLQKALEQFQKAKDNASQADIYFHLAQLSQERQQYDDAFLFLVASLEAEGQNTPEENKETFAKKKKKKK